MLRRNFILWCLTISYICPPARVAKLANVAVSEAVGVITLGVRVSPRAQNQSESGSESGHLTSDFSQYSLSCPPLNTRSDAHPRTPLTTRSLAHTCPRLNTHSDARGRF
jgi:hypothetical protein